MTSEDLSLYGRVRTMCEFVADAAYVLQSSGGLDEDLRSRIEESLGPVREARDWMWRIGRLMAFSRPLPKGVHEGLEITEACALDALPKFKALMGEACDEMIRTSGASEGRAAGRSARRLRAASPTLN